MQEFIKASLDYIEQNLKTDIMTDELAGLANYSVGHFCRIFAQTMDSTVAHYILKRRLDHALIEISSGRKAIDVVLEYGFDTYAGFYKAFVRMYGCSPKKYLSIYKKSEGIRMQNERDIEKLLENWDIPSGLPVKDASIKKWETGEIEWQVWKIGEDYYLKTNERSKMIRNIRIAKVLAEEGLTSEFLPVPTVAGEDYVDGEQVFLLTKRVGEPFNNRPLTDEEIQHMENNENREKYADKLGVAIAKIHRALAKVQDDIQPYEANIYAEGLNAMLKVKEVCARKNVSIDENFFADYEKNFGKLYEKIPKQLIHGNPTGDAVVYENGEPVGIKGYETYNMSNIRLFDICWCAGEVDIQDIETYLKTLKEILEGYDSLSPLTKEEKQSVYYVLCVSAMNCIAYCDEKLDVTKRNIRALEFLSKNREMFMDLV